MRCAPFSARARPGGVVECDLSRLLECSALGDPDERSVLRSARERAADDCVLLRSEDERQRRRAVTQIRAGDLARLDRLPRAVEDVVHDLKDDAEVRAELPQRFAAAEHAGRFEQLRRLQRAALDVGVNGRLGVVPLPALHGLAAHEAERRIREDLHRAEVAGRGEL